MKKKIVIFATLLIIILIGLYTIKGDDEFKSIEINKTSNIYNKGGTKYMDTLLYIGLDMLDIRGVTIVIRDLGEGKKIDSGTTLRAYIRNVGNQYVLYIANMGRREAIKVISHELIHIKQYNEGRLIDSGEDIIWCGDTISKGELVGINYFERGWEVEAFKKQDSLDFLILNKLYK